MAINGVRMSPATLLTELNRLGGENGERIFTVSQSVVNQVSVVAGHTTERTELNRLGSENGGPLSLFRSLFTCVAAQLLAELGRPGGRAPLRLLLQHAVHSMMVGRSDCPHTPSLLLRPVFPPAGIGRVDIVESR